MFCRISESMTVVKVVTLILVVLKEYVSEL